MSVTEGKRVTQKILLGQDENSLVNLVAYNLVSFLILKFLLVIYLLSGPDLTVYYEQVFNRFVLPLDPAKLAVRPWTVITHFFVHEKFLHLLANMLWLWLFGYIFQEVIGNKKLLPLYLYGGVAGCLFYLPASYAFSQAGGNAYFFGANVAVLSVAMATTAAAPGYRIFPLIKGGLPLWVLMVVFALIDFAAVPFGDFPQYIAHASGLLLGYVFIRQLNRGKDWSAWLNNFFDWVRDLFNPEKKKMKRLTKEEFFYKVNDSEPPYKKTLHVTQQRIDSILDKINQQGYNFLTDEEKDLLKRASNDGVL